jgi:hypothetical protein
LSFLLGDVGVGKHNLILLKPSANIVPERWEGMVYLRKGQYVIEWTEHTPAGPTSWKYWQPPEEAFHDGTFAFLLLIDKVR